MLRTTQAGNHFTAFRASHFEDLGARVCGAASCESPNAHFLHPAHSLSQIPALRSQRGLTPLPPSQSWPPPPLLLLLRHRSNTPSLHARKQRRAGRGSITCGINQLLIRSARCRLRWPPTKLGCYTALPPAHTHTRTSRLTNHVHFHL